MRDVALIKRLISEARFVGEPTLSCCLHRPARFTSRGGKTVKIHPVIARTVDLNRTDILYARYIRRHARGHDGKCNLCEIALCHVRLHYRPINVTLMRFEGRAKDTSAGTRARDVILDIINNCNVDA